MTSLAVGKVTFDISFKTLGLAVIVDPIYPGSEYLLVLFEFQIFFQKVLKNTDFFSKSTKKYSDPG